MEPRNSPRILLVSTFALLAACYTGVDFDDSWYGDGGEFGETSDGDAGEGASADGSGDSGSGDSGSADTGNGDNGTSGGDGDGDTGGTTSGDGDGDTGTTGDGDGDTGTTGDGDGDTGTTGDGDGDTGGGDDPLPNNNYCNPVSNWDAGWVQWELQVIDLVNQARAQGGNCGTQGNFGPSGPLTWEPALTCASRVHSLDMGENNYFDHTNLQGNGPGWRLDQAGYNGGTWGENIAAGYSSPAEAVQGWLDSDGHCANMLNSSFSETGVGYANVNGSSYSHYWTQTFGG